jgi:hypothetical protein
MCKTNTGKKAIYYYASYDTETNYNIVDIPRVYDISYFYFNVDVNGNVYSPLAPNQKSTPNTLNPDDKKNIPELQKLSNTNIKLTVGGWTASTFFSDAVKPQNQDNFVKSLINILNTYKCFNGVNIDWEYLSDGKGGDGGNTDPVPNHTSPDDTINFISFVQKLKNSFKSNGMEYYTIGLCCIGACYKNNPGNMRFDVVEVSKYIDELHVMTYDFHMSASWSQPKVGYHTNPLPNTISADQSDTYYMYSSLEAAQFYIDLGVQSTKIYIGSAFYAHPYRPTILPSDLTQPPIGIDSLVLSQTVNSTPLYSDIINYYSQENIAKYNKLIKNIMDLNDMMVYCFMRLQKIHKDVNIAHYKNNNIYIKINKLSDDQCHRSQLLYDEIKQNNKQLYNNKNLKKKYKL